MPPLSPLLRLPLELHHQIISHLLFPETAHLRATSRHFSTLIPPQPSTYLDLAAADASLWATRRRRLTCAYCARMRPARHFTEREKAVRADKRACRECADAALGGKYYVRRAQGRWPRRMARTRFTEAREVVLGGVAAAVDRVEVGVCRWCDNAFRRWGGRDATRDCCWECPEYLTSEEYGMEARRLYRDLERVEVGTLWHEFDYFDLEDIRAGWDDWWDGWFFEWGDLDVRQEWAEGHRGVNIRSRE